MPFGEYYFHVNFFEVSSYMGFLCRSVFQVTAFFFLPVLSSGQYTLTSAYLNLAAPDARISKSGHHQQLTNDTIFLADHYVYGLSIAFKYILSAADEEGRILKTDTIAEPSETQPDSVKKNKEEQIIKHPDDPASPSALLLYKRRYQTINADQEFALNVLNE
jgi:hypothetical protein